jgi:hypothetical protein
MPGRLPPQEYLDSIKQKKNNIIKMHLLIIKLLSEKYYEASDEEIIKFFEEEFRMVKELEDYVGITNLNNYMETFGNSVNFNKAKKRENKYDYFNSVFFIKERESDITKDKKDDGLYYYTEQGNYDPTYKEFYNIVYFNAFKNCEKWYSINRFELEYRNFITLIRDLITAGIAINFKEHKEEILNAINNTTIFENKKEEGKARNKMDCNNPHDNDKAKYREMTNRIISLSNDDELIVKDKIESSNIESSVDRLGEIETNAEEDDVNETVDLLGGRFKRKTQKRKTQKRKTQKRKTKKRNYKQKRRY